MASSNLLCDPQGASSTHYPKLAGNGETRSLLEQNLLDKPGKARVPVLVSISGKARGEDTPFINLNQRLEKAVKLFTRRSQLNGNNGEVTNTDDIRHKHPRKPKSGEPKTPYTGTGLEQNRKGMSLDECLKVMAVADVETGQINKNKIKVKAKPPQSSKTEVKSAHSVKDEAGDNNQRRDSLEELTTRFNKLCEKTPTKEDYDRGKDGNRVTITTPVEWRKEKECWIGERKINIHVHGEEESEPPKRIDITEFTELEKMIENKLPRPPGVDTVPYCKREPVKSYPNPLSTNGGLKPQEILDRISSEDNSMRRREVMGREVGYGQGSILPLKDQFIKGRDKQVVLFRKYHITWYAWFVRWLMTLVRLITQPIRNCCGSSRDEERFPEADYSGLSSINVMTRRDTKRVQWMVYGPERMLADIPQEVGFTHYGFGNIYEDLAEDIYRKKCASKMLDGLQRTIMGEIAFAVETAQKKNGGDIYPNEEYRNNTVIYIIQKMMVAQYNVDQGFISKGEGVFSSLKF